MICKTQVLAEINPSVPRWTPGCKNGSRSQPPAVCINQSRFNKQETKILTNLGL